MIFASLAKVYTHPHPSRGRLLFVFQLFLRYSEACPFNGFEASPGLVSANFEPLSIARTSGDLIAASSFVDVVSAAAAAAASAVPAVMFLKRRRPRRGPPPRVPSHQ